MLIDLGNKNAFVEVTNLEHGGLGWELGRCLWSPVKNRGGSRSWEIMNKVSKGDIIFHIVKLEGVYQWKGISIVTTPSKLLKASPPKPTKWFGMGPYYRIDLEEYLELNTPLSTKDLFKDYEMELMSIKSSSSHGLFYNLYGGRELRISEGYLFKMTENLYHLFERISDAIGFDYNPIRNTLTEDPTDNEPPQSDWVVPGRSETIVSRIVRDTNLVREIKRNVANKCQVCGQSIPLPNGKNYSEGHHLQPLGGIHKGGDIKENIIILCPNHHTEFDYGSIAINPITLEIVHVNMSNPYHGRSLEYHRPDLGREFIQYHYDNIFK
ncbi:MULTISPECIES: HNH endonuclease [Priestia]|uniref:HNH endonuclease n=1 Tax=Priestia TaxID=2800373 RepID=UPI000BF212EC|nr:HNH endonuclease [Priestia aryabhattai]PEI55968.1 hypothetical protein CN635_16745 [Priestia aryabhattai]